jgi:hypothetical protein
MAHAHTPQQRTHIACPGCNRAQVRRSHSRWYDRALHRFSLYAFRCKSCERRFYRLISQGDRDRILA